MLNWIDWNRTVYKYKMDLVLPYNGWYVIKPNQTKTIQTYVLGKLWTPNPPVWVKYHHCCSSTRIAFALNNPLRLICLLETAEEQDTQGAIISCL